MFEIEPIQTGCWPCSLVWTELNQIKNDTHTHTRKKQYKNEMESSDWNGQWAMVIIVNRDKAQMIRCRLPC